MPRNRLPRITKKLQTKKQKVPEKTTEESSGCMRLEMVEKWHNSMISTWRWW